VEPTTSTSRGTTRCCAPSTTPLPLEETLRTLRSWFPSATLDDGATAVWWSDDPWSGGTYSAPGPGQLASLAELRRPIGPLVLAGEHTEVVSGYLESAIRSGHRAAPLATEIR
jgi:monoamine oxidase